MMDSHGKDFFILIIEHEVGKMEAVYSTLAKEGYTYGFARSKDDAVKILAANLHAFVILDYALPGMTGEEFQRTLSLTDSKTKIIFTFPRMESRPNVGLKDCRWLGVPFLSGALLDLIN